MTMATIRLRNAGTSQTVWFTAQKSIYPYPTDWSKVIPSAYVGPSSPPLEIRLDEANPIVLSLFRSANGAAPFCTYPAADESAIVVNADSPAAAVSVNNVPVTIRRDQRTLSSTERQSFLAALDRLNLQPPRKGPKTSLYGDIVGVHAEMVHDMHGLASGGSLRFKRWQQVAIEARFCRRRQSG